MSWYPVNPLENINIGDVLTVGTLSGRLIATRASSTALPTGGGALGVALSSWVSSTTAAVGEAGVRVAESGMIATSVTGLGSSPATALVGVNASGRCQRVSARGSAVYIVGVAGPDGSMLVRPELPAPPTETQSPIADMAATLRAELSLASAALEKRLDAAESTNTAQSARLSSLESSSASGALTSALSSRLDSAETQLRSLRARLDLADSAVTSLRSSSVTKAKLDELLGPGLYVDTTEEDDEGAMTTRRTYTTLTLAIQEIQARLSQLGAAPPSPAPTPVAVATIPVATTLTLGTLPTLVRAGTPVALPAVTVLDQNNQPMSGQTVTWTSGTPAVATIADNASVIAVADGKATLTATCGSARATCSATVALFQCRAIQLSGAITSRARAPLVSGLRLTGTMTLELWVRPDELVDDKVIVGTDHDGEGELVLSLPSGQTTRVFGQERTCTLIYEFGGTGAGRQRLSTTMTATVGKWVHVAVVRETATNNTHTVRLFIDGVSLLEQTTAAVTVATPGYRWALGGNGSTPLAGAFADLRIWSTARTAAELSANNMARLSGRETGLVGCWRLDETGNPTALAHATDASMNFEATEVVGVSDGPGVTVSTERVSALRFDGDTRLMLGRPQAHPWDGSYTVEMWLRPQAGITKSAYVLFQYGGDGLTFGVLPDGTVWGGPAKSAPGVLRLGEWSHVAVVIDRAGAARTAPVLYVNGALVASASAPVAANANIRPTVIGFQPYTTWGGNYIGDLAELRIWSRTLAAHELRAILQRRPNRGDTALAGWWTFPPAAGQTAIDLSPHANHGVVLRAAAVSVEGPTLVSTGNLPAIALLSGASATPALRFDGNTGSMLRVPDHSTNRLTGDLTVECWVRQRGTTHYGFLYMKSDTVEGAVYLMAEAEERSFRYYGEGNTATGPNSDFCPAELVADRWYHVAFVRDATRKELRYYVNGNLLQINTGCNAMSGQTTTGEVTVGPRLVGDLCELRVWSIARDEAGLRRDLGRRIPSASGLVARWAMDEGTGTAVRNTTEAGSAIHGTLVGGVTWVADGPALSRT